jgi:hypothetical protein
LSELFQYDEKLSSIVDSVIHKKEENVVTNSLNEKKEESFMDRLANGL